MYSGLRAAAGPDAVIRIWRPDISEEELKASRTPQRPEPESLSSCPLAHVPGSRPPSRRAWRCSSAGLRRSTSPRSCSRASG